MIAGDLDLTTAHAALLEALDVVSVGPDKFRAGNEPSRFGRVFGGQLLAQAIAAADATIAGQRPSSLHASFLDSGNPEQPLLIDVRRLRDGRSLSMRTVEISQDDQLLLFATVSFCATSDSSAARLLETESEAATSLPTIQDWAAKAPGSPSSQSWIDHPPATEMRIAEPPFFFDGEHAAQPREHWMRAVKPIEGDGLQAAVLAYASDYFLLDMAFRNHPERHPMSRLMGLSLDHSIWFHRPVRVDGWHRHTQELLALEGDRGLVVGSIRDSRDELVASVSQQVLVRVTP